VTTVAAAPALTVRSVRTVAVAVPMRFALGTSAATVREAPLLLVDLETEEGVTGRSYLFCYRPSGAAAIASVLRDAVELIAGEPVAPVHNAAKLERRFALIGVTGVVRMALSALDMALWDALAVAAAQPLATLLGASPRPIPAYNSCGLGLMTPEAAADEAEQLLAGGFTAVKLRLGHPTLAADLAVTRAVRRRLADDIAVMVDYNQALTVAQALERGRALAAEGVYWIEEPIRHDDLAGHIALVRELALPIQIGENFDGAKAMAQALDAGACDFVMPDAARIGGVTGWRQAAGVAASRDVEMSSHLMPELSAHLLAATPTAHWLEYVDWANAILAEPLAITDGCATASARPGTGLAWNDEAVKHYRLT
jgi:mandelate racemase